MFVNNSQDQMRRLESLSLEGIYINFNLFNTQISQPANSVSTLL